MMKKKKNIYNSKYVLLKTNHDGKTVNPIDCGTLLELARGQEKMGEYERKSIGYTEEMTFEQLLIRWQMVNEYRLKGSTKSKYENLINKHILPELGTLILNEINSKILNAFIKNKLRNGRLNKDGSLSPNYVRSISNIILSALKYAASEGFCCPLEKNVYKPGIIKSVPVILSIENQKKLEKYMHNNQNLTNIGILISLYTGLRIGEICALSWNDIDFKEKTLSVRHTVARVKSNDKKFKSQLILDEPKTLSSKRIIPIPSQIFSILCEYRKESKSQYVVSDTDSFISPRTYEARFQKIMRKCEIYNFNYHGLRHTFATRCIEAGVDTKSLSEILGHSNVSITLNTYVHSSVEMKKRQLEKLGEYYNF